MRDLLIRLDTPYPFYVFRYEENRGWGAHGYMAGFKSVEEGACEEVAQELPTRRGTIYSKR